ncbi:MAG: carboxymuconolactone decarboxylase family protein [Myxococcota bacterium]|nr:carboxymuconolactone decarboxylase family protein [Myxococcota bacterium]
MNRLTPLPREELAEFEPLFALVEANMGFLPNSMRIMARKPELLRGFGALIAPVLGPGAVAPELKQLVAYVASVASGCRYCQAHTAHSAHRAGSSDEKIAAAFEFETSPLFDERERAALALAADAATAPPAVSDAHFEALRKHFGEDEILEIVAVIAAFGFLNRWNDTLATELEDSPLSFAREGLAASGWEPGEHGQADSDPADA